MQLVPATWNPRCNAINRPRRLVDVGDSCDHLASARYSSGWRLLIRSRERERGTTSFRNSFAGGRRERRAPFISERNGRKLESVKFRVDVEPVGRFKSSPSLRELVSFIKTECCSRVCGKVCANMRSWFSRRRPPYCFNFSPFFFLSFSFGWISNGK